MIRSKREYICFFSAAYIICLWIMAWLRVYSAEASDIDGRKISAVAAKNPAAAAEAAFYAAERDIEGVVVTPAPEELHPVAEQEKVEYGGLKRVSQPAATENPVFYGYKHISDERKAVVRLAKEYVGKISYFWGGKPSGSDIKGVTEPKRLDCSGFIQFIFSKALGKRIASVGATISISSLEKISKKELKPGDVGLKLGTGSLYIDAEGKAHAEPGQAKAVNEGNVRRAENRIEQLESKIRNINQMIEGKRDKIEDWRERRTLVLEKARSLGKIRVSNSRNSFSVVNAGDEEIEEAVEEYSDRYADYGWKIEYGKEAIEDLAEKRSECQREIAQKKGMIKKYDKEVQRRIDHVGLYCGKDKNGSEIWCHCSSSGNGVVWEHTSKFQYYYRYFKN